MLHNPPIHDHHNYRPNVRLEVMWEYYHNCSVSFLLDYAYTGVCFRCFPTKDVTVSQTQLVLGWVTIGTYTVIRIHRLIKHSLDNLRPIRTAEAFEAVDWLHQQTWMH